MEKYIFGINDFVSVPKTCGIYVIRCVSNRKIYIGKCENIRTKIEYYKSIIKRAGFRKELDDINKDIRKYGTDKFTIEIICMCDDVILSLLECYFINKYNSVKCGYNNIRGSKNIKKDAKYRYNTVNEEIIFERDVVDNIKAFMINLFDVNNNEEGCIISFNSLEQLLTDELNEFNKYINHITYEIIMRLDLKVYIKRDDDTYYMLYGYQVEDFFYSSKFKYDKNIDFKLDYWIQRYNCIMYIECPKYKGNKNIKDYMTIEEFLFNKNIIDVTYRRYKYLENISFYK